jgi:SMI1 / KNR4 family (SUKH-1)
MSFKDQLNRIQHKLNQAKKKDVALDVFGADEHQYELSRPVSTEEVIRFEEYHNVDLPEEYKAFITTLGNGGPGSYGGAGPYYGIYALGDFGYMEPSSKYMPEPCVIDSSITEKKWKALTAFEEKLDHNSLEYNRKYELLFSGLMFIGTMGDSGQMMLILNGIDRGRVVFVNQDLYPPMMKEKFLDWYEAWLDKLLK